MKIITYKNFLTGILLFMLISCDVFLDEVHEKNEQENFTSAYMGKWTGSYTGDLNGTLIFNVHKNATVEINRNGQEIYSSALIGSSFNVDKAPSGFILYGNLENKSGTWEMGNLKGTWSVAKN